MHTSMHSSQSSEFHVQQENLATALLAFHIRLFLHVLFVCRLVAKPCAHLLQIQEVVPRQAQPNDVLEKVYRSKAVQKAPF